MKIYIVSTNALYNLFDAASYWLINMSFKTTTEIINTYFMATRIYDRELCKDLYRYFMLGLS